MDKSHIPIYSDIFLGGKTLFSTQAKTDKTLAKLLNKSKYSKLYRNKSFVNIIE